MDHGGDTSCDARDWMRHAPLDVVTMVLVTFRRKPTPLILRRAMCCARFASADKLTAQVADRCQDRAYANEFGMALLHGKPMTNRTTGSPEADGLGRGAAQEGGILERDVSRPGAIAESSNVAA
jgi:hypothetical protein